MSLRLTVKNKIVSLLTRLKLIEPAKMAYFALRGARPSVVASEIKLRVVGAPDGMAVPSPRLLWLVTRNPWATLNMQGGDVFTRDMIDTLARNGIDAGRMENILDFGCGCGRMTRYLKALDGPDVYGTDVNPTLTAWCDKNLKFGHFGVNGLEPPLDFDYDKFDLILSYSVYTHLTLDLQKAWTAELRRVLKPGGHLYFTTMGKSALNKLTVDERARYDAGEFVVLNPELVGKNFCGALESPDFVKANLTEGFSLVDYVPEPSAGIQDVYILRKA